MGLVTFVLACYGITNIVCFGKILHWARRCVDRLHAPVLSDFVRCPMCVGFWAGLAVSLTGYGVACPPLDAAIGSAGSSLLYAASVRLCEEC